MLRKYWLAESDIPAKTCDEWIDRYEPRLEIASIGQTSMETARVDTNIRDSRTCFPNEHDVMMHLGERMDVANSQCFGFDINPRSVESQFTEYKGDTNQYYGWHEDSGFEEHADVMYDRKLSCIVLLSDPCEFEGGEFQIGNSLISETIPLKKGSVVVFPSMFGHQVTPVTNGVRYTMVGWMSGPHWR